MIRPLLLILGLGLMLEGCATSQSSEDWAAERTAKLRIIYPPGMSKEEIDAKFGKSKPDFSAARPHGGWSAYSNPYIIKKIQAVETSTGKTVQLVERYWGPDGLLSLCYCWFFYDAGNKVIDVEWQYMSD
jgi:hypothetical protein